VTTLHFTPTSGAWLNLVEAFFSIITRQALRRGNFPTVADLVTAIQRFTDAWNDRCAPLTWTKDPDTIIAKAADPRRHQTQPPSVTEHEDQPRVGELPDRLVLDSEHPPVKLGAHLLPYNSSANSSWGAWSGPGATAWRSG